MPEQSDTSYAAPPPSQPAGSVRQEHFNQHQGRSTFSRLLGQSNAVTPSELLGHQARVPSRILPRQIQNPPLDSTSMNLLSGTFGGIGAGWLAAETAVGLENNPNVSAEGMHFFRIFGAGLTALGVSSAAITRLLNNAALTNHLYALENGPDAPLVVKLLTHLVGAVPTDQQDSVLEHLAKNWNSLTQHFFAAVSEDSATAQRGITHLVENRELNRALGLNPAEIPEDEFKLLDILSGGTRTFKEIDRTRENHQSRDLLKLRGLSDLRDGLGNSGAPNDAQRERARSYAPRLEQAEAELLEVARLGVDTEEGKSALDQFRTMARDIHKDVEEDHILDSQDSQLCTADYNQIMEALRTLYREIPPEPGYDW
jgi:hypothetical protein